MSAGASPEPGGGPPLRERHLWEIPWVRDLAVLFGAGVALWAAYALRGIVAPLLFALLLVYLFDPLVVQAERRLRLPRVVAVSALLLAFLSAELAAILWAGPRLASQLADLLQRVPEFGLALVESVAPERTELAHAVRDLARAAIEEPLASLSTLFTGTTQAVDFVSRLIGTATSVVMNALLIPVYYFFFAWKFDRIRVRLRQYLPASRRERVLGILRRMDGAVSGFFRARLLIGVIMGLLFAVGWSPWVSDVPYWAVLAVGTGVASLIPYAASAGWLLALLVKYLDMASRAPAPDPGDVALGLAGPTAVYAVVQLVEGWVLTPWIQGRTADLSAVTVLIVVLVGGAVAGLYGLLLAIPAASCAKILLSEVALPRLERWAAEG